jgi:hypothetical protein
MYSCSLNLPAMCNEIRDLIRIDKASSSISSSPAITKLRQDWERWIASSVDLVYCSSMMIDDSTVCITSEDGLRYMKNLSLYLEVFCVLMSTTDLFLGLTKTSEPC